MFKTSTLYKDMAVAALIGAFIGYLAPFGMHQVATYISVLYWSVICVFGYCIYKPVINLSRNLLSNCFLKDWPRVAVGTIAASVLMSFTLPVVTWLFFATPLDFTGQFLQILPKAIVIGGVITAFSMLRELIKQQKLQISEAQQNQQLLQQEIEVDKNQGYNKLMSMLPIDKRGKLICLQMDDHYLKVQTDKGQHLLLIRFRDVMELIQDYPGLQTHRSWWVALDAVVSTKKEGRKHILVLNSGVEVPVSQTYFERVKELGLV